MTKMKTPYIQPRMIAVELHHRSGILIDGSVRDVDSNVPIQGGGASTNDTSGQGPRVKESSVWDVEW